VAFRQAERQSQTDRRRGQSGDGQYVLASRSAPKKSVYADESFDPIRGW
jgi:hypothetical protein